MTENFNLKELLKAQLVLDAKSSSEVIQRMSELKNAQDVLNDKGRKKVGD